MGYEFEFDNNYVKEPFCSFYWMVRCTNPDFTLPSSAVEVGGTRYCQERRAGSQPIECNKARIFIAGSTPQTDSPKKS